ncbi:glycoside hydrolase family 88 protein [uncultured Sunxiuqinia sp.]|uniref:glycoside hydrolase family 88/105 protein n=1 Tax=uncultured Sunxiuqinia sp. TaxID=1573825 RepID=UPI002AA7C9B7|nr:glycoside hydrolase family 88 protein [uncultured Sunxiuqinia sp.]
MKNTNKTIVIIFLLSICYFGKAQSIHPDPQNEMEIVLQNIAGNVIRNTSFKVINTETKETFTKTEGLPISDKYRVESVNNTWNYWNGVLNMAFLKLSETLDDDKYRDFVKRNVSFLFDHEPYFRKQYEAGVCADDMNQRFRFNMLDHCGAIGASIIANQANDPQERYRAYIDLAADYIMYKEHRLEDGTFARTPEEMKVWADDLYMSVPFLARMGTLTGNPKYFDEAANQVILFNKTLWDEQTRLFFHVWYDDTKQHGVAHWGRANGWTTVAQVDLLERLPLDHPKRDTLISLLTRQIVGLSRYQDGSGMWHQLLDKENTFLETSCTAMFTYAIAKAVNEGWLHKRYAHVAAQGWKGIETRITPDGQIKDICQGTAVCTANYYYTERNTPLNDLHGIGAVLLAGSEVKKLHENGIKYQW